MTARSNKSCNPPLEIEETILQQLMRTYYAVLAAFEDQLGVTRPRWHVLRRLFENGELSQAALQQRLNVDPAAVTRQVKQLEVEGLVTRATDPQDNRYTLVRLTPRGIQLVETLMPQRHAFEETILEGLSAHDRVVLSQYLTRIRTNLARIQPAELVAEAASSL